MSSSQPATPALRHGAALRVLTLNLWQRSGAWSERCAVLIDGLRQVQPDLVAFQEVVADDAYNQIVDLLGAGFHIMDQATRAGLPWGCAVASRWPITHQHEVDLNVTARTAGLACRTLVAEIQVPSPFGPLLFVNHLPSYHLDLERERELQAIVAARHIHQLAGDRAIHVVLAGDFSCGPDAANVRFWRGLQSLDGFSVCYRDAWDSTHPGEGGYTVTARNPLRPSRQHPMVVDGETPLTLGERYDYIMVRCGHHGPTLDVARCELLFAEPIDGVWASDHFGVVADLVVPVRPAQSS